MERQHALILIGADAADDREQLLECLEEAVFTLANYFMRREFIPALAAVKKKKLHKLIEATEVLGIGAAQHREDDGRMSAQRAEKVSEIKSESLINILEAYHQQEAQIKRKLANTLSPQLAAHMYATWEAIYLHFAGLFCTQYELEYGQLEVNSTIKLSDTFDYNLLKVELQDKNREAHQLHRYYSRLRKILGYR